MYCRQTLVGGNYGLLDPHRDYEPNPDFYAALLWRHTMGTEVLSVVLDDNSPSVRAYAPPPVELMAAGS